jgi:predicted component of type VI protein secretion system
MVANQANKGGAITRSKTMMDNLRRNDTKKVKRNEGEVKARQVIASVHRNMHKLIVRSV